MMLAVALFISGVQFFSMGLLGEHHCAHLLRIAEQTDLRFARSEKPS